MKRQHPGKEMTVRRFWESLACFMLAVTAVGCTLQARIVQPTGIVTQPPTLTTDSGGCHITDYVFGASGDQHFEGGDRR